MCFSAEASFISSGVLAATGAYAITKTLFSEHKRFILVAIIPLMFAIQQLAEGLVWVFIDTNYDVGWKIGSYIFLFFALFVWPSWVPFSLAVFDSKKSVFLYALAALGLLYGFLAYPPLLFYPSLIETTVCHHSLCYSQMHPFQSYVALIAYLVLTIGSALISSWSLVRYLGLLIAVSAVVSFIFYSYAFISVWCFFSALISIYIGFLAYKLDTSFEESL